MFSHCHCQVRVSNDRNEVNRFIACCTSTGLCFKKLGLLYILSIGCGEVETGEPTRGAHWLDCSAEFLFSERLSLRPNKCLPVCLSASMHVCLSACMHVCVYACMFV